jgi:hypothetical protein
MSDPTPEGGAQDGDGGRVAAGRPPSRAAVALAGAVALLVCAFWLSCHEGSPPEPQPRDPAQPSEPR